MEEITRVLHIRREHNFSSSCDNDDSRERKRERRECLVLSQVPVSPPPTPAPPRRDLKRREGKRRQQEQSPFRGPRLRFNVLG